jgi:hypothetical protein
VTYLRMEGLRAAALAESLKFKAERDHLRRELEQLNQNALRSSRV